VKEPTIARETEARVPSVFDTLSAGFRTVNRHPRILAIPVLLDLFFWLGPRLSLAPLVQQTFGSESSSGVACTLMEGYSGSEAGFIQAGESFNLLSLLAVHYPGLPSLMASVDTAGAVIGVGSAPVAMLLFLLLPVLGVGLASLYYVMIAQRVAGREDESTARLIARSWRSWGRLLRFLMLLIGVSIAFGTPLVVLALLLGAASGLMNLAVTALWVAAIWAQFYLFFLVDAVVISDVGPIQAARSSVAVVRAYLRPTLGLVIVVWVITMGMPIVWDSLAGSVPGTLVGILGNAYIAVGLAAASMIYYRNRFATIGARD
jgi:hypothetical protein